MPLVPSSSAARIEQAGNTSFLLAQQGRTADYATPTNPATALVEAVDVTVADNLVPNIEVANYIKKIYRPSDFSPIPNVPGLEDPTFALTPDRQKTQPGPSDYAGPMDITRVTEGLEPLLQSLTCDRVPTVAATGAASLRYTFKPDSDPLSLLTMEELRGNIPGRVIGMQVNGMNASISRSELATFTMTLAGLQYQANTAGTTPAAGTPVPAANAAGRAIPVVDPMDRTGFEEIQAKTFLGWQALIKNADGVALGGQNASFTYNNNFEVAPELIGTQHGTRFIRPPGTRREISATFTYAFFRENYGVYYDFLEGVDNGPVTLEYTSSVSGQDDRRLAFIFANSAFEAAPIPPVNQDGEIQIELTMRAIPNTDNEIVSIEYDTPITKAVQLQTYN